MQRLVLHGTGEEEVRFEYRMKKGSSWVHTGAFEGVIPNLERRYRETTSEHVRRWIHSLMNPRPCPDCGGRRLKPESLAVRIEGRDISAWAALSVAEARRALGSLALRRARRPRSRRPS